MVPTTLIDEAELVWRLCKDHTQAQVGKALGWSREAVKDYVALAKIDPEAWKTIGATFAINPAKPTKNGAPEHGASAPSPFTEGLLRCILDLTPAQQLLLCTLLAKGKEKGHAFSKHDFTAKAAYYRGE